MLARTPQKFVIRCDDPPAREAAPFTALDRNGGVLASGVSLPEASAAITAAGRMAGEKYFLHYGAHVIELPKSPPDKPAPVRFGQEVA